MPIGRVKPSGVTAIEATVGVVTVTLVDWEILPRVAEIFVVPAANELTRPAELTVAVAVEDEPHVTRLVTSVLLPSL